MLSDCAMRIYQAKISNTRCKRGLILDMAYGNLCSCSYIYNFHYLFFNFFNFWELNAGCSGQDVGV